MVKKISNLQLLFIVVTLLITTADIFLPSIVAKYAKTDAWISVIIVTIFGIINALIIIKLCLEYKNKTLIEILDLTLGKYIGKILGLIIFMLLIFANATIIRELCEILKAIFLPGIPLEVISIMTSIITTYATYKGLEAIARMTQIALPIGLFVLGFVIFFSFRYMELNRFLPVLENGFFPAFRGALPMFAWLTEITLITLFFPYLSQPKKSLSYTLLGVIIIGFSLFGGTFTLLVFGADATGKLIFAPFKLVESITIARILHFDFFIMLIWVIGIFIKSSMFHFVSAETLKRLINIKNFKNFIIPIGIMNSVLAIIEYQNIIELMDFFGEILYFPFIIFFTLLPLTLLIITKIKKARTT